MHAFGSDEGLGLLAVSIWVAEDYLCQWCTTTRIVDDVPDNTFNVSMSLSIINCPELSWALAVLVVGFENPGSTFTLGPDYSTHFT